MKRTAMLLVGVVMCHGAYAQKHDNNSLNTHPGNDPAKDKSYLDYDDLESMQRVQKSTIHFNKAKSSAAVRWSEDFASGFNSPNGTWTTSGANANLVMYDMDGPDSLLQFGWGPLPSPTASNGFAVMDWYRRIPDVAGFASSPAQGILTSPTINLGSNPDVFLSFYQQIYWCCNVDQEIWVELSTDGGTTWPHKYKANVSDRNIRHWEVGHGYYFEFDISSAVAANPSNVKIRFNWTSLTADVNGQFSNAYFWMIDDVTISDLPRHKVKFTSWQDAPAHDIIFNGDNENSRYGHFMIKEPKSIVFDSNIYNFGSDDQTGVDLLVEIFDAAGNPAGSVRSNNSSVLMKGDTLNFNDLTTTAWTPTSVGEYTFVYTIISDSIPGSANSEAVRDSFEIEVTDSVTSLDFETFTNSIGTDEVGEDGSAIASRFTFDNPQDLFAVRIDYSTATVAGGDIQIEVYDTTGFSYTGGFGGSALVSKAFTVSAAADNGAFIEYDMTTNGIPEVLPSGTYYFVVYMFSNAGANRIAIANNASFDVNDASSIMFDTDDNRWFSGYTDSDVLTFPIIRSVTYERIGSLDELESSWLALYPNPSNGIVQAEFALGGEFSIELMDLSGKTIDRRVIHSNSGEKLDLDYSSVPAGTYLIKVIGTEGSQRTARLVIQ